LDSGRKSLIFRDINPFLSLSYPRILTFFFHGPIPEN
jgi:hypothetical protein